MTTKTMYENELRVSIKAAKKAGEKIITSFKSRERVIRKSVKELVTKFEALRQSFFKLKRGDKASFIKLASTLAERDVDYDEADAVLMAQWWAQQQQAQRAIGG